MKVPKAAMFQVHIVYYYVPRSRREIKLKSPHYAAEPGFNVGARVHSGTTTSYNALNTCLTEHCRTRFIKANSIQKELSRMIMLVNIGLVWG